MKLLKWSLFLAALLAVDNAARSQTPHCAPGYVYVGGHTILQFDSPPRVIGGHCQKITPPPPGFSPLGPVTILPDYYLITILYSVPGELSEAKYGAGATAGSKTDNSKSFKAGISLEVETNISDITAGYAATSENGTSVEVKKEDTATLIVDGVADPTNTVNHDNDIFYLWVNPQVAITQTGPQQVSEVLGVSGNSIQIVSVTAKELKNPSLISEQWKIDALSKITDQDRSDLLSMDPPANGKGVANSPRYVRIDTLQLDGPDNTGDPVTGQGLEVDSEQTVATTTSIEDAVSLSVHFGGAVSWGIVSKVMAGPDFEWTWKTTQENSNGTLQKYEVALKTAVVGFHAVVDIYQDTLLNSLLFVERSMPKSAAEIFGVILDESGHPAANQLVTVATEQGETRRVFTNARGEYRVFEVPTGKTWIGLGGVERELRVKKNAPQKLDLRKTKKSPIH